jgi:YbbR domain-containing protein
MTPLKQNLGLKLIALALAILLELYFYSPDNSVSTTIFANLEIGPLPPSTVIVEPVNLGRGQMVEFQVKGPKSLVDQVKSAEHKLHLLFPENAAEDFTLALDPLQLALPTGVELVRLRPERIKIRTEKEAVRELVVVVDKIGEVPEGMRLNSLGVFPDTVKVRGPRSIVEPMQSIETESLDLSQLNSSTRKEVMLKPLSSLVTLGVNLVTADISISPIPMQKTFSSLDVEVLAPEGFAATVEPSRATVVVEGPTNIIKNISREGVHLIADARKLPGGKHELALQSDFPDEVKVLRTDPPVVWVIVEAPNSFKKTNSK